MKNDLSVLKSVNELLYHSDDMDPEYTILSGICRELKDAHMELGICVAGDCDDFDCVEKVKGVMIYIADVYSNLIKVVEEERQYGVSVTTEPV